MSDEKLVRVDSLESGERFLFDNLSYITTDSRMEGEYVQAVAVYSGKLIMFTSSEEVRPIQA